MSLPAGWEIIDRLPQEFIIDGQDGITEPVGMRGSRLESRVHIVISPSAGKQNIVKAIHRAGLEVENMMLEPLAAADSTLTDDDREYGCALINIGAELTSLMIFGRGAVQHTRVFPFGGMHFTKDIAMRACAFRFRGEQDQASLRLRRRISARRRRTTGVIEITPVGRSETRGLSKGNSMRHHAAARGRTAAASRARSRSTGAQISSGVVLSGGGSQIRGMVEIAEQVFSTPRRGSVCQPGLLSAVSPPRCRIRMGDRLRAWP
jgi:cell division protein FtsA